MNLRLTMSMILMGFLAACATDSNNKKSDHHHHDSQAKPGQAATTAAPRTDKGWVDRQESLNVRAKQGGADLVFIGDSITQGWEGSGKDAWSRHFGKYRPMNLGIGGDRTQHVLWRLENGNLEGIQPKGAVIMIGTNNVGDDSAEDIADGIAAIVSKLRMKRPATKILLLAVFPREEKPGSSRAKIIEINKIISRLADGKNVRYLDIGGNFINKDGTISKEIMPDFLHLSEKGYEIWASSIDNELKRMMK